MDTRVDIVQSRHKSSTIHTAGFMVTSQNNAPARITTSKNATTFTRRVTNKSPYGIKKNMKRQGKIIVK